MPSTISKLLAPAIYIQLARTDAIAACLRLGELWGIAKSNPGDYILSIVVLIAASIVISVVAGVINIIPCVGQIVTLALGFLILPDLQVLAGALIRTVRPPGLTRDSEYAPLF